MSKDGFVSFSKVEGLNPVQRRTIKRVEKKLKRVGVMLSDEVITGVIEEEGIADDILQVLVDLQGVRSAFIDVTVEVHSRAIYDEILDAVVNVNLVGGCMESEAMVNTKYKTVAKKIKPVATQLPPDTEDHIRQAEKEPKLRETRKIGHKFTDETIAKLKIGGGEFLKEPERKKFQDMLSRHGKAFASSPDEIGCVQPSIVAPMVIFTVPHVPWDL